MGKVSGKLSNKELVKSTIPREFKKLILHSYKWLDLIDYLNTTNAKPDKVLNLVKQSFQPVGKKVVKTDDHNLVRRAWTLYVVTGIFNKLGTPEKLKKKTKITDAIRYFIDSKAYKISFAAISIKERKWEDRSYYQHEKNCRKLWDSSKGKLLRKELEKTKGKIPIKYKGEFNPIFGI